MFVTGKLQMRDRATHSAKGNSESMAVVQPIPALGFSLFEAGRLYARRFQKRSRAIDLMACRALITLAQNEGVTQRRLAELTAVDTVALGRIIDRLEACGWTERRPRPGDRRARSLTITPTGRALVPLIWKTVKESQLAALAGLSQDEISLLAKALERVLANLKAKPSAVAVPASDPDLRLPRAAAPPDA
jgi:MarR family transcriptional regulator, transcriptional regulator for hemolysin